MMRKFFEHMLGRLRHRRLSCNVGIASVCDGPFWATSYSSSQAPSNFESPASCLVSAPHVREKQSLLNLYRPVAQTAPHQARCLV